MRLPFPRRRWPRSRPLRAFDPATGHVLTISPTGAPPQAGPGVRALVTARSNPEVPS